MEIEELKQLADSFFEWPTEDRTQVTLTSALLFAQHVLRETQQQAEPVGIRSAIIDVLLATSTLSEGMSADAILSLFDQKPIGVISKSDAEFMERGGNGVVLYANRLSSKVESFIPVFLHPAPQLQQQAEPQRVTMAHMDALHKAIDHVAALQNNRLRFQSACEISGDKHPEYVRGYEAAMDAVCKTQPAPIPTSERLPTEADADCDGRVFVWMHASRGKCWLMTHWLNARHGDYWLPTGLTIPPAPGGDA